jgi:hypothetical protein
LCADDFRTNQSEPREGAATTSSDDNQLQFFVVQGSLHARETAADVRHRDWLGSVRIKYVPRGREQTRERSDVSER